MAFYSTCMLQIALQLAEHDEVYADMACRFLDHFIAISQEINGDNGGLFLKFTFSFYFTFCQFTFTSLLGL